MTTRTRMLRRMFVWRRVATSGRATLLAGAQVNPAISRLHALFANSLLRLFDVGDPIDVNAYLCCHSASIQAAGYSLLAAAERCWDNLTLDITADRTSKLVRPSYQRTAKPDSRRHKTIDCQCCGK